MDEDGADWREQNGAFDSVPPVPPTPRSSFYPEMFFTMVTSPQRRRRHFSGQDLFKIVPISCTPLTLGDLNHTINRFDASEITTTAVILLHRGEELQVLQTPRQDYTPRI